MRVEPRPVVKSARARARWSRNARRPSGHEHAHAAALARRRAPAASSSTTRSRPSPGMVVLDAVLEIQRSQAPDLAVRWNCKAAKCGSCSAEVNGRPALMCKTRLDHLPEDEPITRRAAARVPGHPRPRHRRELELRGQQAHPAVHAEARCRVVDRPGGRRPHERVPQVHRVLPLPGRLPRPARPPACTRATSGPRFLVRIASLEMHPLDTLDRTRPGRRRGRSRASATSRSAAPRSAPRASTSPTTRSSRSRSASSTGATTRCCGSSAGSPGTRWE